MKKHLWQYVLQEIFSSNLLTSHTCCQSQNQTYFSLKCDCCANELKSHYPDERKLCLCVCVFMHQHERVCVHACPHVCECAWVHACMCICVHVKITVLQSKSNCQLMLTQTLPWNAMDNRNCIPTNTPPTPPQPTHSAFPYWPHRISKENLQDVMGLTKAFWYHETMLSKYTKLYDE